MLSFGYFLTPLFLATGGPSLSLDQDGKRMLSLLENEENIFHQVKQTEIERERKRKEKAEKGERESDEEDDEEEDGEDAESDIDFSDDEDEDMPAKPAGRSTPTPASSSSSSSSSASSSSTSSGAVRKRSRDAESAAASQKKARIVGGLGGELTEEDVRTLFKTHIRLTATEVSQHLKSKLRDKAQRLKLMQLLKEQCILRPDGDKKYLVLRNP